MENKKIKICHIANTDKALKALLLPQLKFLINEGYDVCAVSSPGKWVAEMEKEGIKVKTISMKRKISPLSDLVVVAKLFFYFKKENFDIVHVHNPKPSLLGQLSAKIAGVPIIINTVHGLYFHENTPYIKRKFFIFIEKISASFSNLIFSQNQEDIETIIREKIARPDIIKYLGNGINIDKFNSEKFSKDFIDKKKEELNIPKDCKVIGIVARLVEEKGYLDLFKAFKLVLSYDPKTILLSVGPKEPEKKDAVNPVVVKEYGIENNVIFLGERSDLNEIYPLMDIFVLPSYREGMPRSILEAMSEKRSVIATNIRGCREEIENNVNGILIPTKSPEILAEKIIYLLENNNKALELENNARTTVEKYFNEDIVFGKIKMEYEKLINKKIKQ